MTSWLVEAREALDAVEDALDHLYAARDVLHSARNWSLFDILGGAGISTYVKRSKMRDAQKELRAAEDAIRKLSEELRDVDGIDGMLNTSEFLTFADYFLDNVFMDMFVHQQISETQAAVWRAIDKCEELRVQLTDLLEKGRRSGLDA